MEPVAELLVEAAGLVEAKRLARPGGLDALIATVDSASNAGAWRAGSWAPAIWRLPEEAIAEASAAA
jgi:hypothetical protein